MAAVSNSTTNGTKYLPHWPRFQHTEEDKTTPHHNTHLANRRVPERGPCARHTANSKHRGQSTAGGAVSPTLPPPPSPPPSTETWASPLLEEPCPLHCPLHCCVKGSRLGCSVPKPITHCRSHSGCRGYSNFGGGVHGRPVIGGGAQSHMWAGLGANRPGQSAVLNHHRLYSTR